MREYAFDVKMFAVVRIKAESRGKAEAALSKGLDTADLMVRIPERDGVLTLTEASIFLDDVNFPYLFEVDGHEVDNDELEAPPPGTPAKKTVD